MVRTPSELARELTTKFLVPLSDSFYAPLAGTQTLASLDEEGRMLLSAFEHSLRGVESVVSLPYVLAWSHVTSMRFHSLHMAERIRSLNDKNENGEVPEASQRRALATARERMNQELENNVPGFLKKVLDELQRQAGNPEFVRATSELLSQGTILAWSAVEVLLRQAGARRRVPDGGPRAFAKSIFPEHGTGDAALKAHNVWLLYQQRHILVHRLGVVDQAYLDATGETATVGEKLVLTPAGVERHLANSRDFAVAVAQRL